MIHFFSASKTYDIPNSWYEIDLLSFPSLFEDLCLLASGGLSLGQVRTRYLIRTFELEGNQLSDDQLATLVAFSEEIDFFFDLVYPDGVIDGMPDEVKKVAQKVFPEKMSPSIHRRVLLRKVPRIVLNNKFCRQLLPELKIGSQTLSGYSINYKYGVLTSNLTAIQFVEAQALVGHEDKLPLLAAMLYAPACEKFDISIAHQRATDLEQLPATTLAAINFIFGAFVQFVFSSNQYHLLVEGEQTASPISKGALESLYDLSADGLGNVQEVEQMNVIQYLSILRKKTIDAVKALAAADMDRVDISKETGLPIATINHIL